MVIDFTKRKTIYYDPLQRGTYLESILVKLFKFIEAQLKLAFNTKMEKTEYRNLTFEKGHIGKSCGEHETGIYVCRQAEMLCTGKQTLEEWNWLSGYRNHILQNLLSYSHT